MPLYTEHLNLAKPNRDERYNIAVPNGNMDILDETIRELREELANKANISQGILWLELELLGDFATGDPPVQYTKNGMGYVHISGVIKTETPPVASDVIAYLPQGFRPSIMTPLNIVQACGQAGNSWATFGWILPNGYITFTTITPPSNYSTSFGMSLSATFPTAE